MKIDILSMAGNYTKYDNTKVEENNKEFLNLFTDLVAENSMEKNLNFDLDKESEIEDKVVELMAALIINLNSNGVNLDNNEIFNGESNFDLDIQNEGWINWQNSSELLNEHYVDGLLQELNLDIVELNPLNKDTKIKLATELFNKIYEKNVGNEGLSLDKELTANNLVQDNLLENHTDILVNYGEVIGTIDGIEKMDVLENRNFNRRDIFVEETLNNADSEISFLSRIAFSSEINRAEENINQPVIVRNQYLGDDILKAVRYLSNNKIEELNVKMTPEDLGEISIKLLKEEGNSEVIITLANKKSFDLVKENLIEIEKHLSNLDIKVKQVVVQMKNQVQNDFSGSLNQQFNKNSYREERNKSFSRKDGLVESNEESQLKDDSNINLLI